MSIKSIIVLSFVILTLSGCFFSAKEIVLDPDKGYIHTKNMEE